MERKGDDLFSRAATEKTFRHSDLERCGAIGATSWKRPPMRSAVKDLLASKYLPVRVDQDANPDLSSRYGDWGWPRPSCSALMARESPRSGDIRA